MGLLIKAGAFIRINMIFVSRVKVMTVMEMMMMMNIYRTLLRN